METLLIAESGSTKCDWLLSQHGEIQRFQTLGLNPVVHSPDHMKNLIEQNKALQKAIHTATNLYFYGAGCSLQSHKDSVMGVLRFFNKNNPIEVNHDLVAASRSVLKNEPGIVAILGTGSNACFYDGTDTTNFTPSLGYVLGDEGGGVDIGKRFLKAYFYHWLPENIDLKLELTYEGFIENLYRSKSPNTYLASFVRVVADHIEHKFISTMVSDSFSDFIINHLNPLYKKNKGSIYFVGSVAYVFKDLLEKELNKAGMRLGAIEKSPMDGLLQYHQNHLE